MEDLDKGYKKSLQNLERIAKGFANQRRIQILELLDKEPGLSVLEISEKLNTNFKTASSHILRLTLAGLIIKRSEGLNIRHKLTNQGLVILNCLRILE